MKRTWFARIAAFALALGAGAGAGFAFSASNSFEADATVGSSDTLEFNERRYYRLDRGVCSAIIGWLLFYRVGVKQMGFD